MNLKNAFYKFIFPALSIGLCFSFIGNCNSKNQPFTQSYIQQITQTTSTFPQTLKQKTYTGCEVVPATGNKPQFEGQEYTGQTCSVKILPNNKAEVSFLSETPYSLSLLEENSDSFAAQINNNEVLILQIHFHQGQVLSATQTSYDENNHLNYGRSGKGKFIKACIMSLGPICEY